MIAKQHLQGVAARRQGELDLRLAAAEVAVLLVIRDRQGQIGGQTGIDEQVVVTRVVAVDTGRRDAPTLKALAELRGPDDVTFGIWCEVVSPGRVRVGDAVAVT